MQDLNQIALVARLAKDPELRSTASGMSVANLRVAFNTSKKNNATGEWEDVGNFLDVVVWGTQAENVTRTQKKGNRVGIQGRIEVREWTNQEGQKRSSVEVVANSVQYLTPKDDDGQGSSSGQRAARPATSPVNDRDFQPAAAATGVDDDIPF